MADRRGRSSNDLQHYQPPRISRKHGRHMHKSMNTRRRSYFSLLEKPKKAVA